jgi:hypothetical protein
MHPLAPDLSQLSDDELQKKMIQAYTFGNTDLAVQLQMLLEDYTMEVQRRQAKMMEELMAKSDKFKGIIDIG